MFPIKYLEKLSELNFFAVIFFFFFKCFKMLWYMVYVVIVFCLGEIHFFIRTSNFWWRPDVLIFDTHPSLSFFLTCSCFRKSCNIVFQVSQAVTTHILLIGNIKEEEKLFKKNNLHLLFEVLNESKRKKEIFASFQR